MTSSFWETTIGKTLKVALWSGASAFVATLIVATQNNPNLIVVGGIVLTPLVNVGLVFLKNLIDPNTPNV